jgi:oxygen-independent coproporphyrinogen-3 oxidase
MCRFQTSWTQETFPEKDMIIAQLREMEKDELVVMTADGITVTEKGKPFVRNICMAFDLRLKRKAPQTQLFSMTI